MENIITCFTGALLLELHKWSIGSCMAAAHLQQKPQTQEAGNDLNSLIWVEEYIHEWKIRL
jgi:hypothetical protein